MLRNYNKYLVLKVFLDNPTESFRLREICRTAGLSPVSVLNYLGELRKEELVEKYEKRGHPLYRALRDNINFGRNMKLSILHELYDSGLVDEIWDKCAPQAIILFGSYSRGEAIEESDIDLFVLGKPVEINEAKYKKILGKNLHILFEDDFKKVPNALKNNLLNGTILRGYLEVFK